MSINNPLVTVGLPFQGNLNYLRLAVRSVFAQTYGNWELLCVGDGANQDCVDWLGSITDPRVSVISHASSAGLPTRLNEMVDIATGAYFARIDSDDMMFPDRLQRQVSCLTSTSFDLIGSRACAVAENGKILGQFKEPALPQYAEGFLYRNAFSHPTVTGSASWFKRNKYDPGLHRTQDKELWLRGALGGSKFYKMNETLTFYRLRDRTPRNMWIQTAREERLILRRYGPNLISPREVRRQLAVSYTKEAVQRAASTLPSLADALTKRRFESEQLSSVVHGQLQAVIDTRIPGEG